MATCHPVSNSHTRGKFISVEGPDGAGKSTQVKRIADYLQDCGFQVEMLREPGGTWLGEKLRELLLDVSAAPLSLEAEALLYAASRAQLIRERIQPALEQGRWVVCDRYVYASLAYQGYGNQLPLEWIGHINRLALSQVMPDRTYLIDVPLEVARERLAQREGTREDRIERRGEAYHRRVRQGFLQLASEDKRICLIDGNQSPDVVTSVILCDLKNWVKEQTGGGE